MRHSSNGSVAGNDTGELHLLAKSVGFLAVLTAVLYLRAIVGGGYLSATTGNVALLAAVMIVATAGLLLAWRWEAIGSVIAIVGGAVVAIVVYMTSIDNRWLAALVYSSPFLVAGILFLADWLRQRNYV